MLSKKGKVGNKFPYKEYFSWYNMCFVIIFVQKRKNMLRENDKMCTRYDTMFFFLPNLLLYKYILVLKYPCYVNNFVILLRIIVCHNF